MAAVKRYQIFHASRTTGGSLLRAMSDEPATALNSAKALSDRGEKDVVIVDSQSGKTHSIQSFASEHKLR